MPFRHAHTRVSVGAKRRSCRSCTAIHASDCQWIVATCNMSPKLPEGLALTTGSVGSPRLTFQVLPTIPVGEGAMDQRATNAGDSGSDDSARGSGLGPRGLSRRDFAARFGAGSAAAVGVAWAAPHITTIKFAAKAAVGSAPPGSTTTTSTTIEGEVGSVSLSSHDPCAGDILIVRARGFVPKTAVTIEIDSAEHTVAVTTAGGQGRINVAVRLPTTVPTGVRDLVVVGVKPGGRTLTLHVPVTIRSVEECAVGPE